MKYLLLLLLFSIPAVAFTQDAEAEAPAEFFEFENEYSHALRAAAEIDRAVFIFGYTSWSGASQRMLSDVFSDENLRETFQKYFVTLKLDMEKGDGIQVARDQRVMAYPAHLFILPDESQMSKSMGVKSVEEMIGLLDEALAPYFPEGRPE